MNESVPYFLSVKLIFAILTNNFKTNKLSQKGHPNIKIQPFHNQTLTIINMKIKQVIKVTPKL